MYAHADGERRDLHARVVEARASTQIGERIRHERRPREAITRAAPPQPFGQAHGARPDDRGDGERAVDLAEIVEHADQVGVGQTARRGIAGMHGELDVGTGQLASVELIVRSLAGEMSVSG